MHALLNIYLMCYVYCSALSLYLSYIVSLVYICTYVYNIAIACMCISLYYHRVCYTFCFAVCYCHLVSTFGSSFLGSFIPILVKISLWAEMENQITCSGTIWISFAIQHSPNNIYICVRIFNSKVPSTVHSTIKRCKFLFNNFTQHCFNSSWH